MMFSHLFAYTRYDVIEGSSVTISPTSNPTSFPTSQPTKQPFGLCDNSICDPSEDASSCPSDCESVIFNANDVGAKGNMSTRRLRMRYFCHGFAHA